jgi:N-acetylmuramoyl-L-alanine amidase
VHGLLSLVALLTAAPCIALDAGHGGGRDDGTTAAEHKEKVIALQITKRVRDALKATLAGYDVVLTREDDRELSLVERARIANKAGCKALVSVHINGSVEPVMHGIEAYSLDTGRQRYLRRLSELLTPAASDTSVILRDLRTRQAATRSAALSELVLAGVLEAGRGLDDDTRSNGVRKDLLLLLLAAEMPSTLIEIGYLSTPRERSNLIDARYQQAVAAGIAKALATFVRTP